MAVGAADAANYHSTSLLKTTSTLACDAIYPSCYLSSFHSLMDTPFRHSPALTRYGDLHVEYFTSLRIEPHVDLLSCEDGNPFAPLDEVISANSCLLCASQPAPPHYVQCEGPGWHILYDVLTEGTRGMNAMGPRGPKDRLPSRIYLGLKIRTDTLDEIFAALAACPITHLRIDRHPHSPLLTPTLFSALSAPNAAPRLTRLILTDPDPQPPTIGPALVSFLCSPAAAPLQHLALNLDAFPVSLLRSVVDILASPKHQDVIPHLSLTPSHYAHYGGTPSAPRTFAINGDLTHHSIAASPYAAYLRDMYQPAVRPAPDAGRPPRGFLPVSVYHPDSKEHQVQRAHALQWARTATRAQIATARVRARTPAAIISHGRVADTSKPSVLLEQLPPELRLLVASYCGDVISTDGTAVFSSERGDLGVLGWHELGE